MSQNLRTFQDKIKKRLLRLRKIEEIHINVCLEISSKSNESGTYHKKHKSQNQIFNYHQEMNCLRDKFSRFLQVFVKFVKLNPQIN